MLRILLPVAAYIKPKAKEFSLYDAQCEGLALRVQPSGVRSWVCWERTNGKTRRITLGRYPEIGAVRLIRTSLSLLQHTGT